MRALHSMLWSDGHETKDIEAFSDLTIGDETWNIRLDRNVHGYFRNGTRVDSLPFQHSNTVNKYIISLHELLKEENKEFADHLIRQMAGGYNIDQTMADIDWNKNLTKISYKKYNDVREELRKSKGKEKALLTDEKSLDSLREREKHAIELNGKVNVYGLLFSRQDHLDQQQLLRAILDGFPQALGKVSKDRLDHVIELIKKVDEKKADRVRAEREKEELGRSIEECSFPGTAPSEGDLVNLRKRLNSLEMKRSELIRLDARISVLSADEASQRRRISEVIQRDGLKDVDVIEINDIAQFTAKEMEIESRKGVLASLGNKIDGVQASSDANTKVAIRCLEEWLSIEQKKKTAHRYQAIGSASSIAMIVSSTIATVIYGPTWLLATAAGVAMLIALWIPDGSPSATECRMRYESCKVGSPLSWSTVEVFRLRDALLDRLGDELGRKQLAQQYSAMQRPDSELGMDIDALEKERASILERYGISIRLKGYSIQLLMGNLSEWKEAEKELTACTIERKEVCDRFERELAAISDEIRGYGMNGLGCVENGEGRLQDLEARSKRLKDLESRHELLVSKINELSTEIDDDRKVAELTKDIGTDELEKIIDLRSKAEEYRMHKDKCISGENTICSIESQLSRHVDLFSLSREEIDERMELARSAEADLKNVRSMISDIESRIKMAGIQQDIIKASSKLERANADLVDKYESSKDLFIGRTIAEHIKEVMAEKQRPAVFERARQIFSDITKGAYELRFREMDKTQFKAYDNTEGEERSLDELSSATRVQLLLAVRVAFLEEQEPVGPMPLFLDEALANSDDCRAVAIIDSVIELARHGRQIFYLTAQSDEECKWRSRLDGLSDVSYSIIDLAKQRDISVQKAEPFDALKLECDKVPAPDGMDRAQYCIALGVPRFEPQRGGRGAHLWYVVDEVDQLFGLLSMGITTWGQMKGYMDNGGTIRDAAESTVETVKTVGLVLEKTAELWSEGRADVLSQEDIKRMNCGSEPQIKELIGINDRCGNDGRS
ncbi:MAG: hypothetical protein MIO90_07625, partial [Methanomassiliicoccales archaeon]|nr:hypothetical protein [Methanomassiliicoccales archaeon]